MCATIEVEDEPPAAKLDSPQLKNSRPCVVSSTCYRLTETHPRSCVSVS